MRRPSSLPFLLLAFGALAAATPRVGGPCAYVARRGTARFTELREGPEGVEARFTFIPASRSAPRLESDKDNWLVLATGLPSRAWLEALRIAPGRQVPATRNELVKGTCTPVIYGFPTLPDKPHGR